MCDRLSSARIAPAGELRFGAFVGFFSTDQFPRPGVAHAQTNGRLAAAFVPIEDLEVFASVAALANRNEQTVPRLIQAVGDLSAGVKYGFTFSHGLRAATLLSLQLPAGVGSVSLAPSALGLTAAVLGGWEPREVFSDLPVDLSLRAQAAFVLDRTGALLPEDPLPTLEQEYALGASRYSRATLAVWASARLPYDLAPFVELSADAPLFVPDAALAESTRDEPVSYPEVVAWRVVPGLRWAAMRGLALEAALELGLGGAVIRGFASAPPWALRIGASFALDPVRAAEAPRPPPPPPAPVVMIVPAPQPEPTTGWIEGRVLYADGSPASGAVVTLAGWDRPPVASDEEGRFRTYPLPPGKVALVARKPGYRAATGTAEIAAGKAVGAMLMLEPEPPPPPAAQVAVRVSDEAGLPLGARVVFAGPVERAAVAGPETGTVLFADLPPGPYAVTAFAEGRLARRRALVADGGGPQAMEVQLLPAPPKPGVLVGERGVQLLRPLAFTSKSALEPSAAPLLDEVLDALLRLPRLAWVRVEAHVARGPGKPERAVEQTRARAQAVAAALAARGLSQGMVTAEGLGWSRPAVPGGSKKAREANARVEILFGVLPPRDAEPEPVAPPSAPSVPAPTASEPVVAPPLVPDDLPVAPPMPPEPPPGE